MSDGDYEQGYYDGLAVAWQILFDEIHRNGGDVITAMRIVAGNRDRARIEWDNIQYGEELEEVEG